MTRTRVPLAAVLTVALAAGCVSPSRTSEDYRRKAANTAETMASVVESARLTVELALRDRAFGPYLSTAISEAEDDASATAGAFDTVQPPGDRADALRRRLDDAMEQATSALGDARIALRTTSTTSPIPPARSADHGRAAGDRGVGRLTERPPVRPRRHP